MKLSLIAVLLLVCVAVLLDQGDAHRRFHRMRHPYHRHGHRICPDLTDGGDVDATSPGVTDGGVVDATSPGVTDGGVVDATSPDVTDGGATSTVDIFDSGNVSMK